MTGFSNVGRRFVGEHAPRRGSEDDPGTWTGDWSDDARKGNYLKRREQVETHERLNRNIGLIVAMAIRGVSTPKIGAVLGVSCESIQKRLRPQGLGNDGRVGAPVRNRFF